jgi:hypothetical protein
MRCIYSHQSLGQALRCRRDGHTCVSWFSVLFVRVEKKLGIRGTDTSQKLGRGSKHRTDIDAMTAPLHPAGMFLGENMPAPSSAPEAILACLAPLPFSRRSQTHRSRRRLPAASTAPLNGLTNRCVELNSLQNFALISRFATIFATASPTATAFRLSRPCPP